MAPVKCKLKMLDRLPRDILHVIIGQLDFHSLINLARADLRFYVLIGLDFKKLCLDNVVMRLPGETWADAFYEAPNRTLENLGYAYDELDSWETVVVKSPTSDAVLSFSKKGAECRHALLWHLDLAARRPTISFRARRAIHSASFTGDGKRIVIVTADEMEGSLYALDTCFNVYDSKNCRRIGRFQIKGRSWLYNLTGGVYYERLSSKIYNFRTDKVVDLNNTRRRVKLRMRQIIDGHYEYVDEEHEAIVFKTGEFTFDLFNFHLGSWKTAVFRQEMFLGFDGPVRNFLDRPFLQPCVFNAMTREMVVANAIANKLYILDLDQKLVSPVPTFSTSSRSLVFQLKNRRPPIFVEIDYEKNTMLTLKRFPGYWRAQEFKSEVCLANRPSWNSRVRVYGVNFVNDEKCQYFVGQLTAHCLGKAHSKRPAARLQRLERNIHSHGRMIKKNVH